MTVGACAAADAIAIASAPALSYIGSRYEGKGQTESLSRVVIDTGLALVPFGGKNLEAVRWFGKGRQYKSALTAFKNGGSPGSLNQAAVTRLYGQTLNTTNGLVIGFAVDELWK